MKTSKLWHTARMMIERGIRNFKCATTLEFCSSTSTLFTKARTISRRVPQSGSCKPSETRPENASNWPITSRNSASWVASP